MAQRATGFTKRMSAPDGIVADALVRALDDDEAPCAVPIELAPLVAPYRKHGRLSLRVERLPPRARLSRGHNNGDRSWSLMSDELDNLSYLPPKGGSDSCTLAIRIVSLDGGTLALLDFPVVPGESPLLPVIVEKPAPRRAAETGGAELRRIQGELAEAQAALATERAHFESELQAQLAASSALAAEALERHRLAWQSEQTARKPEPHADASLAKAEREWKAAEAARLAAAEAKWQERSDKALAEAHAQIERLKTCAMAEPEPRSDVSLSKAEREWKAAEAARLAAAEAKWQERSDKALAEAGAQIERLKTRATAETARDRSDEAERRRLRDEVARLKKSLAERESEFGALSEDRRRGSEAALAEAESRWREEEARRLAAARTQWQDRSKRALAEATAQFERAQARVQTESSQRSRDADTEIERLQDDLTAANAAIADRETDIADIQVRLEDQLREIAALREGETRIRRLEAEQDALRATLAVREREILQSRADLQQAKVEWRRESDVALAIALSDHKKSEGERLQAAEAQGHQHSQAALAKMAQRLKQVEADLQQSRAHAEALFRRGDSDDIKQLRREFGHLQAQLSERDQEIAQLRLDGEHARERWAAEARMALQKAEHDWKTEAEEGEESERRVQARRRYVRDAVLAASFSAIAVMLYLSTDTAGLWSMLPGWAPPASQASAQAGTMPAAPTAAPDTHLVTVLRAANVRAAPSKSAQVVATLPRNADVASLERHGNWVRVKIESAHKEGWVYATFLKEKTQTPATPGSGQL